MPKIFQKQHDQSDQFPPNPLQEDEPTGTREPVRTLLTWTAASRPFRKKDTSYYTTVAILIGLSVLVTIFWIKTALMVGVLVALGFVVYVLGFTPPEDVEYKISTQGITIGGYFYFWNNLDSFYFSKKEGHTVLHILTYLRFPGELMLVLGDKEEEEVKNVVARYLPYHEIAPKSIIDKWADRLQKLFPLESVKH